MVSTRFHYCGENIPDTSEIKRFLQIMKVV